jgi:hypothetical protein
MKSALMFVLTLSSATVGATHLPYLPNVNFKLVNDVTGSSADATVRADGSFNSIADLFAHSVLYVGGRVLASSAELLNPTGNELCSFNSDARVIPINSTATFVDLDNDNTQAVPIAMNQFHFQCQV